MATKILKPIITAFVSILIATNVNAGGPKDLPKKQDPDQNSEHHCDASCEQYFSTFPLSSKTLTVDREKVCKKALLEYLKAEREKERKENDKEHMKELVSNDIL